MRCCDGGRRRSARAGGHSSRGKRGCSGSGNADSRQPKDGAYGAAPQPVWQRSHAHCLSPLYRYARLLLHWAREGRPITELPIQTIYQDGNRSSHFRTVQDSWRIYREILLFSGASFLSFLLDYGLFCLLRLLGGAIVFSNITARLISAIANYHLNRKAVFHSAAPMAQSALRYAILAAGILTVNTLILNGLTALRLPSLAAKMLTELMLFSASWLIQRRWVFSHVKMKVLENPPLPGEEEAA